MIYLVQALSYCFDSPICILNLRRTTCALSGVFRRLKRPPSREGIIQVLQFKKRDSWTYFRDELETISPYLTVYDEGEYGGSL